LWKAGRVRFRPSPSSKKSEHPQIPYLQQKLQQTDTEKYWKDSEWIVGGFWQIVLEGGGSPWYHSFN
jgi:hypothetical protein